VREAPEIYLDYAATTPTDPAVLDAMRELADAPEIYGNPSSPHRAGRRSYDLIEKARSEVAALINAPARDIVFTSGATESDNLAIKGAARFRAHRGRHLVTMATEHKAVLESMRALEAEGFEVTRLAPGADGVLPAERLEAALRDDTQLVSVMHVNNETGVVQDIAKLGALCRERGILFHTDAAQSAGKLPLDVASLPVDLLSLTAHKFYGPQGVGALYVADRPGCGVSPLQQGGSQERSLRAGTEPVVSIAGFGVAARIAQSRQADDLAQVTAHCERLWQSLSSIPGIRRNGSANCHYPGVLNVSAEGLEGESLMLALDPLCVASGSACNAQTGDASFVLRALGLGDLDAQASIRFSFGRGTTESDIDAASDRYRRAVEHLRRIGPATESVS